MIAFAKTIRTIAIGCIVGGGLFGLAKMYKTFLAIFSDIGSAFRGDGSAEYIEGKGWYEWPLKHIPIFMVVTFFSMIAIFTLGGFPWWLRPVRHGAHRDHLHARRHRRARDGRDRHRACVRYVVHRPPLAPRCLPRCAREPRPRHAGSGAPGLVGTTVFGSAISMSGTVIGDYKNSLYIGNRPYHISKGNIMGVVPGAIFGAGVAIFLSIQLANGNIDLLAPQANAFATFSVIFAEGQGDLLLLGSACCSACSSSGPRAWGLPSASACTSTSRTPFRCSSVAVPATGGGEEAQAPHR